MARKGLRLAKARRSASTQATAAVAVELSRAEPSASETDQYSKPTNHSATCDAVGLFARHAAEGPQLCPDTLASREPAALTTSFAPAERPASISSRSATARSSPLFREESTVPEEASRKTRPISSRSSSIPDEGGGGGGIRGAGKLVLLVVIQHKRTAIHPPGRLERLRYCKTEAISACYLQPRKIHGKGSGTRCCKKDEDPQHLLAPRHADKTVQ